MFDITAGLQIQYCCGCSAALRAVSLSALVNLRDPAIMRSIMRADGALCTPDCKQQIDGLICHLVWKETSFFGGERSTFPIQMNRSISALSWGLPTSERGGYGAEKEPSVSLFSLISFPTSYLLPLLISFPLSLIHVVPLKHLSVGFPSPSLSLSPVVL